MNWSEREPTVDEAVAWARETRMYPEAGVLLRELERLRGLAEHQRQRIALLQAQPSVEICQEERAEGNSGCGACALCCKEQRERAEKAESERDAALAQVERERQTVEVLQRNAATDVKLAAILRGEINDWSDRAHRAEAQVEALRSEVAEAQREPYRIIWQALRDAGVTRANGCPDAILAEEIERGREAEREVERLKGVVELLEIKAGNLQAAREQADTCCEHAQGEATRLGQEVERLKGQFCFRHASLEPSVDDNGVCPKCERERLKGELAGDERLRLLFELQDAGHVGREHSGLRGAVGELLERLAEANRKLEALRETASRLKLRASYDSEWYSLVDRICHALLSPPAPAEVVCEHCGQVCRDVNMVGYPKCPTHGTVKGAPAEPEVTK